MRNRLIYKPTKGSRDIVTDIIRIIMEDDGPAPKRNLQPAEKRPTGADQFYNDHQAEYDRLAMDQKCKVEKVQQHNNAYPKLRDELKKRDSIIKVTTISANKFTNNAFDPSCRACAKMLTLQELKRAKIKPRCKTPKPRRRRRALNSRVDKKKAQKPHKRSHNLNSPYKVRLRLSRIWKNKSVQCISMGREPTSKVSIICSVLASKTFEDIGNTENNSVGQIPPEPNTSTSSYNSFLSMGHEPMIGKGNTEVNPN